MTDMQNIEFSHINPAPVPWNTLVGSRLFKFIQIPNGANPTFAPRELIIALIAAISLPYFLSVQFVVVFHRHLRFGKRLRFSSMTSQSRSGPEVFEFRMVPDHSIPVRFSGLFCNDYL